MAVDERLISDRFPRASGYHPEWVLAGVSGGANPLWLTEWLTEALDLRPGMRVLDLGCGRALSSVFLRREFGVQVWATDLWFSASENIQRVRDAGIEDGVFPIRADARSLPFSEGFFDAVVSIDSFMYYGTDDLYLNYLARFIKPGGPVGIALAGFLSEIDDPVPEHLAEWWVAEMPYSLHSASWWRRHWERSGILGKGDSPRSERTDLARPAFCALPDNLAAAGPASLLGIACIEILEDLKKADANTNSIGNIKGGSSFTSHFNSQPGVNRHERSVDRTDCAGYGRGHGRRRKR
jgi:SAM-dependent methyltransferase